MECKQCLSMFVSQEICEVVLPGLSGLTRVKIKGPSWFSEGLKKNDF